MEYKYIDIHTHVNLDAFEGDWEEIERHTLAEGVAHINVGTGLETSKRAIELAGQFDGVYATVGLHPVRASGETVPDKEDSRETFDSVIYRELAKHPKVVAIGECGFDYYRVDKDTKEKQEEAFIAQINLANEMGKPLMLHIRDVKGSMDAYEDALTLLKQHAKVLGNVHFFAGTYEIAKGFWEIGYTTSFTGVITFANEYDETIKNAPLDMLHAETDAPYVAPKPFRGQRNEPLHVREVYKRIAELRGQDEEVVRDSLMKNAKRLFGVAL
jgi:TatD DNase family protein